MNFLMVIMASGIARGRVRTTTTTTTTTTTESRNMAAIHNGNRTEWSPIRSVIIRVINKIGRPRSGSPIC